MTKTNTKAFTLIELLIVIVIIGILAVALIPRLTGAQATARDTARKATLQSAITVVNSYLAQEVGWSGWAFNGTLDTVALPANFSNYGTLPKAGPNNTAIFASGDANKVVLCTVLEKGNGNSPLADCASLTATTVASGVASSYTSYLVVASN